MNEGTAYGSLQVQARPSSTPLTLLTLLTRSAAISFEPPLTIREPIRV